MAETAQGVQLPPDSTGKITGGFSISVHNDTTGAEDTVVLPATVLVNSNGEDIGAQILATLGEIKEALQELNKYNFSIEEALTR